MENLPAPKIVKTGLIFAAVLASGALYFALHASGETIMYSADWVPSLNIAFAFRLDGLSALFALMISFVGALIFAYSSIYMHGDKHTTRFFITLFCFALSMLGLVLADHIVLLFIFWELTSLTSYLLIGCDHTSATARRNALQALLVTGAGGLIMFTGLLWMGLESGSFLFSDILAAPEIMLASPYVTPILLFIVIGCFAKSAQFPLHFWLPNAMVAPTPVSAYLHSATMVKAGIYLLARLQPAFSLHEIWMPLLASVGGITAVWASILALKQDDLKQLLAYTTLMALGTLTFLLAFPSSNMAMAAMAFMLAHALYKAALFMAVGMIDKHTGTRKLSELSGLGVELPIVKWIAMFAALSMAGIPLFIGFVAKETEYTAALELPHAYLAIAVLIAANALMVIAAYKVGIKPFRAFEVRPEPVKPTEPHKLLWLPALLLALFGVLFGMMPWIVNDALIAPAATSLLGYSADASLSLWHGFAPFALSLLTLGLGAFGIWKMDGCEAKLAKIIAIPRRSAESFYFALLTALEKFAYFCTCNLHNGSPIFYVRVVLSVVSAGILTTLFMTHSATILVPNISGAPDWIGLAISALAVAGAWMAARATSKMMALASLGASGFAMAGIFLLHGALDVAMTQLLVETLIVVLAAAVLWRLPKLSDDAHSARDKQIDIAIAGAVGLAVYLALSSVLSQTLDLSITYFYENAAYALANGQNIVNVIIVDFRAFDTLGEVMVIAVAAIGLLAMTKPRLAFEGDDV